MAISKKKQAKKKASKDFIEKSRAAILKKVGYDKLHAKHGSSSRPAIPDYKVESKYPLSNNVANGFKKRTGADHPDAIQFPVGNSHKQGLELIYSPDYANQMNGKKT